MLLLDQPSTVPSDPGALIEEARRRTRKRRARIAAVLLALAVGAAVVVDLGGGGGGGGGAGPHLAGQPSGAGGGSAAGSATRLFPGAPVTQRDGYGVESRACPLARANRYLPARSGCVEVMRADIDGDGRSDLVIAYSRLSGQHPNWFEGSTPPSLRHDFVPQAAFLKIAFASGGSVTVRIPQTTTTWIDSIARVNKNSGGEIILELGRASSGLTMTAYGYQDGRLIPAGVTLDAGGDSADGAGFTCVAGNPTRLIQRTYALIGPTIYAWWRETQITYTWHGSRLVQSAKQTFNRYGPLSKSDTSIGHGCTAAGTS
ncbi:MAG: hypothetical protein ABR946_10595 [Solirubrobacteraceae bacterium]|jgi:hypothetical protein